MTKFTFPKDKDNKTYVRLTADNNKIIFRTKSFNDSQSVLEAVFDIQAASDAAVIKSDPNEQTTWISSKKPNQTRIFYWESDHKGSEKGTWRVEYHDSHGNTVAWTEHYVDEADALAAIAMLQNAPAGVFSIP